jgi:hypothetical protein
VPVPLIEHHYSMGTLDANVPSSLMEFIEVRFKTNDSGSCTEDSSLQGHDAV